METNELAAVLEKLGSDGIDAFYVYLVIHYGTTWLMLAVFVLGVKAVWKAMKEECDA